MPRTSTASPTRWGDVQVPVHPTGNGRDQDVNVTSDGYAAPAVSDAGWCHVPG